MGPYYPITSQFNSSNTGFANSISEFLFVGGEWICGACQRPKVCG
jgi:hypothetical protein